jgi:hypothetical protein
VKKRPLSPAQVRMLRRAASHPWGVDLCSREDTRRWATAEILEARKYLEIDRGLALSLVFRITPAGRDAAASSRLP